MTILIWLIYACFSYTYQSEYLGHSDLVVTICPQLLYISLAIADIFTDTLTSHS